MTTFDDRERSYEAKFARDADLQFKAEARRNRLLGEWAAEVLGKERADQRMLCAAGHDGAERLVHAGHARRLAFALAAADLDQGGNRQCVMRSLRADR